MSLSKNIENRVKNLRYYKPYNYSIFENIEAKESSISLCLKRLSQDKKIVFIGKGVFYKSKNEEAGSDIFRKVKDKYALRHKRVKPINYHFAKHLFWSNQHNFIPLEKFICRVIEDGDISNFLPLKILFGSREIKRVYLNNFRYDEIPLFEKYFRI